MDVHSRQVWGRCVHPEGEGTLGTRLPVQLGVELNTRALQFWFGIGRLQEVPCTIRKDIPLNNVWYCTCAISIRVVAVDSGLCSHPSPFDRGRVEPATETCFEVAGRQEELTAIVFIRTVLTINEEIAALRREVAGTVVALQLFRFAQVWRRRDNRGAFPRKLG
ncbi:unnamed protein product [Ixodes persulcatus]